MRVFKHIFFVTFLFAAMQIKAQSAKDEQQVIGNTQLLNSTIFGTKDSLTLEKLFAKVLTYGHSHGNLQTREEAIKGITKNKSFYTDASLRYIKVLFGAKNTAIVRYLFDTNENKTDGTVTPLHFSMMMVWVKEKGSWKLMGRQAVSIN